MDLTPLPYTDTAPPSAARAVVGGAKALVYGLFRMTLWTLGLAWLLAVTFWRILVALSQHDDDWARPNVPASEPDILDPSHPDYHYFARNLARNGDPFDPR